MCIITSHYAVQIFALHKILSILMLDQSYGHYIMVTTGEMVHNFTSVMHRVTANHLPQQT